LHSSGIFPPIALAKTYPYTLITVLLSRKKETGGLIGIASGPETVMREAQYRYALR